MTKILEVSEELSGAVPFTADNYEVVDELRRIAASKNYAEVIEIPTEQWTNLFDRLHICLRFTKDPPTIPDIPHFFLFGIEWYTK